MHTDYERGQPLSEDLAREAARAFQEHGGNQSAAAASLGLARQTFRSRLRRASERGLLLDAGPAMPGFRVSRVSDGPAGRTVEQKPDVGEAFAVPPGHTVKGVSALLDPEGREVAKWVKTREGDLDPAAIVGFVKSAFEDYKPAARKLAPPRYASDDLCTLLPLADWHLGMFAWGKEVGENWDLEIAEERIGAAVMETVVASPESGEGIVLGGGDLIHSDNNRNQTARSGNTLDVDGRYEKVIGAACRLTERTVDLMRRRHETVRVRILKGNHDEHASVAVAYHLAALYRNEPRVTVDLDPSLFWWHRFGRVLLGATHGHTVKIREMPSIMAHRRAEDWGATKHRYVHGFHLHHKERTATEGEGVITEIHQAPIPQDAWHFGSGYLSGRSIKAITYHRDFGEIGFARRVILDAE